MASANGFWTARNLPVKVKGPGARSKDGTPGGPVEFRFAQPFAVVGSARRADIVLRDKRIPARCLYLYATDDGIYARPLFRHPQLELPSGRVPDDGHLEIAGHRFRVSTTVDSSVNLNQSSPEDAPAERPTLGVFREDSLVLKQRLGARALVVGREAPSDLCLDLPDISSCHCAIHHTAGQVWVVDLVSREGTTVRRRSVRACEVPFGQSIYVGECRIRWSSPNARPVPHSTGDDDSSTRLMSEHDRQELKRLKAELVGYQQQASEYRATVEFERTQNRQREQLRQQTQELEQLARIPGSNELRWRQQQAALLQTQLQDQRLQNELLQASEQHRAECMRLRRELTEARLQADLESLQLQATFSEWHWRVQQKETEARCESQSLQETILQQEQRAASLLDTINSAAVEVVRLTEEHRTVLQDLESDVSQTQQLLEQRQREQQDQLESLQNELKERQQQLEEARCELELTNEELSTARKQVGTSDARLRDLEEQSQRQRQELEATFAERSSQVEDQQIELRQRLEEAELELRQAHEARKMVGAWEMERANLTHQRDSIATQFEKLQVDSQRKEVEIRQRWERLVEQLRSELEAKNRELMPQRESELAEYICQLELR